MAVGAGELSHSSVTGLDVGLARRLGGAGWLIGIAVVAFAVRLVPVLRGSGLQGALSYDGSVYYAASAGLAAGLTPYRDFLLLHPPGIMLVLLPFALVGRLLGDAEGAAAARLAFMAMGALNAVLVSRTLRPLGRPAAVVGGLFYAVFFPAVFMERSDSLEGAATLCLLGALLLLTRPSPPTTPRTRAVLLAGVLLGFGADLKIWGVVVAFAVLLWCAVTGGARRAALVASGVVAGVAVVCAPFFVAAPGTMWRMVVRDQLGRPQARGPVGVRITDILGLSGPGALPFTPPLVVAVVALVMISSCCWLARKNPVGGLAVLLVVSCTGLLLITPTWFAHYAGLTAAPIALVVGAATATGWPALRRRRTRALGMVVLTAALVGAVTVGTTRSFGTPLVGRELASAAATAPGCVTTDDVTALVESNLLRRNFSRHCPLVVDLGGYSYDLPTQGARFPRSHDQAWQEFALRYLSSGSVTIIGRFRSGSGFDHHTAAVVDRWPVIAHSEQYRLRSPRLPVPGP